MAGAVWLGDEWAPAFPPTTCDVSNNTPHSLCGGWFDGFDDRTYRAASDRTASRSQEIIGGGHALTRRARSVAGGRGGGGNRTMQRTVGKCGAARSVGAVV
jgi:hypothetical protein